MTHVFHLFTIPPSALPCPVLIAFRKISFQDVMIFEKSEEQ